MCSIFFVKPPLLAVYTNRNILYFCIEPINYIMMIKHSFLTCTLFALMTYTVQSIAQTNQSQDAVLSSELANVPVDVAYRMVANYAPRAGFVDRDGEQLPNTRTVWFSVAQLKAFINEIEGEGGDGIRFYFAAYDDDYSENGEEMDVPPAEYWGYNTLLMVPTRDSTANGVTHHRDYLTPAGAGTSTIQNRGNLCPPLCGDDPILLRPNR